MSFDSVPRRLWLRFDSLAEYETHRDELTDIFKESDGKDTVTIYCVFLLIVLYILSYYEKMVVINSEN